MRQTQHFKRLKPLIYKIYVELGKLKHEEQHMKSISHYNDIRRSVEMLSNEAYIIQRNADEIVYKLDRAGYHQ